MDWIPLYTVVTTRAPAVLTKKRSRGKIMIFFEYLGKKRHGTPSEYIYVGNKKKTFSEHLDAMA